MDAFAVAEELEMIALLDRGVEEARNPRQWYRDRAAIDERNDELIVRDTNGLGECTHSIEYTHHQRLSDSNALSV